MNDSVIGCDPSLLARLYIIAFEHKSWPNTTSQCLSELLVKKYNTDISKTTRTIPIDMAKSKVVVILIIPHSKSAGC